MSLETAVETPQTGGDAGIRVGGVGAFLAMARFAVAPIETVLDTYARHGPLVEIEVASPLGRRKSRYFLAMGAAYNRRVLSDPTTFHASGLLTPGPRDSAQRRIGNGLISVNGPHHVHYRRLMLPPLRAGVVDGLAPRIGEIIDRMIAEWPAGRPVDLYPLVQAVALQVTLETLFPTGEDGGLQDGLAAAELVNDHIAMESSPAVRACPVDFPGTPFRKVLRQAEVVESALFAWAQKVGVKPRPDNLLSILLNAPDETGACPSQAVVSGHILTLFAAAFETSQSGLAWTLFLLAQHPAAAKDLLEEIDALPTDPLQFSEALLDGERLDAVVRESLRILPPAPFQPRRAAADADLLGRPVARGDYVVLSPLMTNRDPILYPEPARFNPRRWATISPNQYEYTVFSAGPRTCIGARFATVFLKVAVGHILRRYRMTVQPHARIDQRVRITMAPSRGLPMTLHPQDGGFEAVPVTGNINCLVSGLASA